MIDAKKRIVYIEDNLDNRTLVARVLAAEGYEIITAANAKEGLSLVRDHRPNLILVDINMPEIDGLTLTSKFHELEHLNGVPVVAITANVMKGDRERTLAAGCDGYIQKPINVDLLPQQVAKFIKEANTL
jgi:two-component system cell cycle response regulator DivK